MIKTLTITNFSYKYWKNFLFCKKTLTFKKYFGAKIAAGLNIATK